MCSAASPDAVARSDALRLAYVDACRLELAALKPGNVHAHAAGHGMTVADFEESARVSAGPLTAPGRPVGERIRDAVAATRAAVGCNTNLGIVLLAAPLLAAAATAAPGRLRETLAATLERLTVADAAATYEAIRIAAPAGLGRAPEQDVSAPPTLDLRQVMALAAERDRVARQYATTYGDVFLVGLPRLRRLRAQRIAADCAAALVYMDFLAALPDSHILRKHGAAAAETVRSEAASLLPHLDARVGDSTQLTALLLAFDRRLKAQGLNPGTSADLTVASLLALSCEDMLSSSRPVGA
jgi:triphosphoribosyl-dephospho-CoA synthase